jgi:hypothetical protein
VFAPGGHSPPATHPQGLCATTPCRAGAGLRVEGLGLRRATDYDIKQLNKTKHRIFLVQNIQTLNNSKDSRFKNSNPKQFRFKKFKP